MRALTLAPGCPERFDFEFYRYIWTWNRVTRPKVARALDEFAPRAQRVRLMGDAAVARFLSAAESHATN